MSGTERDQRSTTDLLLRRNVDGERFTTTELSDGSMVIVDTEYEGSGVVIGGGVDLPSSATSTLGVSATGAGVVLDEDGLAYVLDPEALEAYRDTVGQQARDLYVHGPELAAMGLGYGADSLQEANEQHRAVDLLRDIWRQEVEAHATHDIYRTFGEVTLDLGASWKFASGAFGVAGSTGATLQVDRDTGDYDVTVDLSGDISRSIGAGVLGVGASGGSGNGAASSITLSFDADGELQSAASTIAFDVTAEGFAGFDIAGLVGAPPGSEAALGFQGSSGSLVETTFEIPIEDDADRAALQGLLDDPVGGARAALGASAADGSVLMQAYDLTETTENVGLAVRAVVSLGASDQDSSRQLELVDAVSYDPVNGLMRRGDCL